MITIAGTTISTDVLPATLATKQVANDFVTKKRSVSGSLVVQVINIGSKNTYTLSWDYMLFSDFNFWNAFNNTIQTISSVVPNFTFSGSFLIEVEDGFQVLGDLRKNIKVTLSQI